MRIVYLFAAERVLRRLAGVLAWVVLAAVLIGPFACAFALGRCSA